VFTVVSGLTILGRFIRGRKSKKEEEGSEYRDFNFGRKLTLFLEFVYR
jgi:hypothetical protein